MGDRAARKGGRRRERGEGWQGGAGAAGPSSAGSALKSTSGLFEGLQLPFSEEGSTVCSSPACPVGEVDSLRLGREKRTRYLNERILRDMAGET